jgi:hypothetical protein
MFFFITSTLESLYPKRDNSFNEPTVVLAIGSSGNIVFKGGPQPWHGKPSGHFKQSKTLIYLTYLSNLSNLSNLSSLSILSYLTSRVDPSLGMESPRDILSNLR